MGGTNNKIYSSCNAASILGGNKNHIKFNSEPDFHWNEYGHRFVSTQLLEQLKKSEFLVRPRNGQ